MQGATPPARMQNLVQGVIQPGAIEQMKTDLAACQSVEQLMAGEQEVVQNSPVGGVQLQPDPGSVPSLVQEQVIQLGSEGGRPVALPRHFSAKVWLSIKGIILGSFWAHLGIILESFGIILGSFWYHFGNRVWFIF